MREIEDAVPGLSDAIDHAAMADGFGEVMLYGAIGVWVLAALSFFTFGRRKDVDGAS